MDPETIMPDGRPLHAWNSELAMLRADARYVQQDLNELKQLMAAMHVANVEVTKNASDGDVVIRVRAIDQIKAYRPEDAILAGEISRTRIDGGTGVT
jgi:hypothetical protein